MRKSFKMCAAIISGVLAVNVFLPCVNASAGSDSSAVIEGTYNFASNEGAFVPEDDSFVYRDDCFTRSSFLGCQHLEILSAQISAASAAKFYPDSKDFSSNPENVIDALKKFGFSDVYVNKYYQSMPAPDSCGVAVARRTIVQNGKNYTLLAIIPRSDAYGQEWAGDFNVGNGDMHEGFKAARDEILRFVKQYISDNNIKGDLKIWTAGHSRGAAVSNMLGGFFAGGGISYFGDSVSVAPEDVYCYTYATPLTIKDGTDKASELTVSGSRTGAAYANDTPGEEYISGASGKAAVNDKSYGGIRNIISPNDIVSLIPPKSWEFTRYGTNIPMDHGIVTCSDALKELRKISDELGESYSNSGSIENFERKSFDLKTLTIVPDTKNDTPLDFTEFINKRVDGLASNAETNAEYAAEYEESAESFAAIFGMLEKVIADDLKDISNTQALPETEINVAEPLIYSYLAYASEKLQSEGRAQSEAEAVAIAIEELLSYLTGEEIDHAAYTADDFILLFAEYITENADQPLVDELIKGMQNGMNEEQKSAINLLFGLFIKDYSFGDEVDFKEGLLNVLKACINGPEPGTLATFNASDAKGSRLLVAASLTVQYPELHDVVFDENGEATTDVPTTDVIEALMPVLLSVKDEEGNVIETYPDLASFADSSLKRTIPALLEKDINEAGEKFGADYKAEILKHLDTVNNNITKIRKLALGSLFYTDKPFNTASNIETLCTLIGNVNIIGMSHYNEVYIAYAKAAQNYDVGYSSHDNAPAATTTAASTTASKTASTTAKSASSPKTGDAGTALPLTVLAVSVFAAFCMRKKND